MQLMRTALCLGGGFLAVAGLSAASVDIGMTDCGIDVCSTSVGGGFLVLYYSCVSVEGGCASVEGGFVDAGDGCAVVSDGI